MKKLSLIIVSSLIAVLLLSSFTFAEEKKIDSKIQLVVATINPEDSHLANSLIAFTDKIKEKSDGRIEFRVFLGGQLGDASSIYQSVINGDIDMILSDTGWFAEQHPEFDILETNYLFKSKEHYESIINTPGKLSFFEDKILEIPGLKTVMYVGGLERNIISTFPINTIDDLKGKNMRSKSVSTEIDWWRSLGVNPVPIAFQEVYTAIQTGVVNGSQNSLDAMIKMRFAEVAKYVARTQHNLHIGFIVINNEKFNSLDPNLQKIILDAGKEIQPIYIAKAFEKSDQLVEQLKKEFNVEFTNPDRTELIEASRTQMWDLAKKLNIEAEMKKIFE